MEMAQEIKGLAAKPEDLSSVLEAYVVEEAGLTKVSSGFCTYAVAQRHPHTYTKINAIKQNFSWGLERWLGGQTLV